MQQEPLDLQRLVVSHQRDDPMLLFLYSGCSIAARISEAIASASAGLVSLADRPFSTRCAMTCGFKVAFARVAQGPDPPPVAEVVRELDDLGTQRKCSVRQMAPRRLPARS